MATVLEAKSCPACDNKFVPKSSKHQYCSKECRKNGPAEPAAQEYTLTDPSNHMLSLGPSALSCGIMEVNGENYMVVTVRTPSTTLTVGLTEKEASGWLAEIAWKTKALKDTKPDPETSE